MIRSLILVLALTSAFGQAAPKTPTIPSEYQTKFQALYNRQKNETLALIDAKDSYANHSRNLAQVNKEGQALEAKMLKELGLDPEKFHVQDNPDGYPAIVANTPAPAQEKK